MRKFSSYGPIDQEVHYHVPRKKLIDGAYQQLLGDNPKNGGHYITVWAHRQTGKTWIMQQVVSTIQQDNQFDVVYLSLQFLSEVTDLDHVAQLFAQELMEKLNLEKPIINRLEDFHLLFKRRTLTKPLILILDEFDALDQAAIARLVSVFRHIYNTRSSQANTSTAEKDYLLHGMALIGVRAVLDVKFPCPYIQKQLFNYFARELYPEMDGLYDPFEDLSDTITDKSLFPTEVFSVGNEKTSVGKTFVVCYNDMSSICKPIESKY